MLDEQEMTQGELARAVHIDRSEVTRWRKGERRPAGLPLLRMLLCLRAKGAIGRPEDVFDWVRWWGYERLPLILALRAQVRDGDNESAALVRWLETWRPAWRAEPLTQGVQLPGCYVPREVELAAWRERLRAESDYRTPTVKRFMLWGMAGVGKTVLAQALALDEEMNEYFRNGVLWAVMGPKRGKKKRSSAGEVVQAVGAAGGAGGHTGNVTCAGQGETE